MAPPKGTHSRAESGTVVNAVSGPLPDSDLTATQGAGGILADDMLRTASTLTIPRPRSAPLPARAAKRAMDFMVAAMMLLTAMPMLVIAGLAILVIDRRNPFFADERIGEGGRTFRCFKLQTMRRDPTVLEAYFQANPDERESYEVTRKLRFDPRVTRLGSILRKSSIDELPQLMNVLVGEMSLVGPRPLAPSEFRRRGEVGAPLLRVRPGLTGLWQINGRSDLSHRRRIALDNFYALHWTIALDLRILAATPFAVLSRRGAR